MIVRNINQEVVRRSQYQAHGGGEAAMLFDAGMLEGLLFMAHGVLQPGKELEAHADPYEEIYYFLGGEGTMMVGGEKKNVKKGDAVWIPCEVVHGLENDSKEDCVVLVVAAFPRSNG